MKKDMKIAKTITMFAAFVLIPLVFAVVGKYSSPATSATIAAPSSEAAQAETAAAESVEEEGMEVTNNVALSNATTALHFDNLRLNPTVE